MMLQFILIQQQFVYKYMYIGVSSRNWIYSIVLWSCSFTAALLSGVIINVYTSCHLQYLGLCYHTPLTNLCHRSSAILRRIFFSLLCTACRWRALKQVFCREHKQTKVFMVINNKPVQQWPFASRQYSEFLSGFIFATAIIFHVVVCVVVFVFLSENYKMCGKHFVR